MAKQPAKAPSQRQLRVAEEIRQALSQALERGDIYDRELTRRPVTITGVNLSPDMRNAMVSFTSCSTLLPTLQFLPGSI